MALCFLVAYMKLIEPFFKSFIPAFTWWLVVLVLMCTPGRDLPDLGFWAELINLDKIIHVTVFGLMAFLFMLPFTSKKNLEKRQLKQIFLKIAICTAIWGLTTEFIQDFFIPGRTFDLLDFVADAAGGLVAYFLAKKYFSNN